MNKRSGEMVVERGGAGLVARGRRLGLIALAVAGALLAGCAGNRPVERAAYDLAGGINSAGGGSGSWLGSSANALPMRLEVRLAAWLDTPDIAYRLSSDTPPRLRAYADSRWAAKAGLLAGERLQAVFGPVAPSAKCAARVEIVEFAQHFDPPTPSRFVIDARWSVSNAKGERRLADGGRFTAEAPSADARGGVQAAAQALDKLGAALLAASQNLAECR